MENKLSQPNQSVEKALRIIEFLAQCESPLSLQEISAQVGMPASTALRLLNTLYINGYVNQDPVTYRYSLSLKFTWIGGLVSSHISVSGLANKALIELSKKCNESTNIAVIQHHNVVYIDVIERPGGVLQAMQQVGMRLPMHCDAIGKIFLSQYTPEQLDDYMQKIGLTVFTSNTIAARKDLDAELQNIREQGYAIDNEEHETGLRSIAAPIRDYTNNVIAGISVSGPSTRISLEQIEFFKNIVMETALKISRRFAYQKQFLT